MPTGCTRSPARSMEVDAVTASRLQFVSLEWASSGSAFFEGDLASADHLHACRVASRHNPTPAKIPPALPPPNTRLLAAAYSD